MKTVLVTAIGSLSADVVVKTLKKHNMKVLGCDIYPKEWIVDAYSVDGFFQVPKGIEADIYINALKKICISEQVDYIFPLTDVEIDTLNVNRDWFQENGVIICISPKETIDVCRNKYLTHQCLKQMDLSIELIPTFLAGDFREDLFNDSSAICKPFNGRSSEGVRHFPNRKGLLSFLSETNRCEYIVQPFIKGSVVTVDVVRNPNTEKVVCIPRMELLRTQNGAGTSVHVFHDDMLIKECEKIADRLGICGCVNFEFIQSLDGVYHFLECKPRFSGGVEFSCMTGYNFIFAHLCCFIDQDIDFLDTYQDCYIARKYEETITALG